MYGKKESLFTTPADSRLKYVYAFSREIEQQCSFPSSSIVAKLYVVPHFERFGMRKATEEMVGENFSNVKEWVGVALRHSISDKATLY
jgi:hypothetical protein